MAGMFDDLIPAKSGGGLSFDDLINPKGRARKKQLRTGAMGEVLGGAVNLYKAIPGVDEGAAALDSAYRLATGQAGSPGEAWRQSRELQDVNAKDFEARRPITTNALRATGGAASMLVPAGGAAQTFAQGSRTMNALRGAAAAAGTGYVYGVTDEGSLDQRMQRGNALASDPVTLALGAGAGALATRARRPTPKKAKAPPAPSLDELKAQRAAAYKDVTDAGVTYAPQATERLAHDITTDAAANNLNPRRHPKAASVVEDDISAIAGQAPSVTELDQLRQVIRRDVANATDDAEAFFGKRMISAIDRFMDGATARDVVAGDPEAATELMKRARDLAQRSYKMEEVIDATDAARLRTGSTGTGGNIDNATRQEMRKVYQGRENWSDEERALLESIVVGDRGQNFLRQVGRLSPEGNGLMQALQMGAAVATNGVSSLAAAGGALAKGGADRITQAKVRELVDLIAAGGSTEELQAVENALAQIAATDPAAAELRKRVAARIAMLAGAGSAVAQPAAAQYDEDAYSQ